MQCDSRKIKITYCSNVTQSPAGDTESVTSKPVWTYFHKNMPDSAQSSIVEYTAQSGTICPGDDFPLKFSLKICPPK